LFRVRVTFCEKYSKGTLQLYDLFSVLTVPRRLYLCFRTVALPTKYSQAYSWKLA